MQRGVAWRVADDGVLIETERRERWGRYPQGVRVDDPTVLALLAQVVVRALCAAIAAASLDLPVALVAGAGEGWGLRVVQVVEHHHAAVLGPPQGVELVVVALAQR